VSKPILDSEDGWIGVFTRHEAVGAMPNGTRVVKVRGESGDATALGTCGTVLGSLDAEFLGERVPDGWETITYAYFVEWADRPNVAVGVMDWKIEAQ
jgi:hypothetical protein